MTEEAPQIRKDVMSDEDRDRVEARGFTKGSIRSMLPPQHMVRLPPRKGWQTAVTYVGASKGPQRNVATFVGTDVTLPTAQAIAVCMTFFPTVRIDRLFCRIDTSQGGTQVCLFLWHVCQKGPRHPAGQLGHHAGSDDTATSA